MSTDTSNNGYAHIELNLRKEARIVCQEANVRVEYVVYNFWLMSSWVMAVHVFRGMDLKTYMYLSPESEIGEELRIESGLVIKRKENCNVELSYPAHATLTLHDIHIS